MTYDFGLSRDQEEHAEELSREYGFINLLCPANIMLTPEYTRGVKEAGITAENITSANPFSDDLRETLVMLAEYHRLIEKDPSIFLVKAVEDIKRARETGKTGIILGLQGLNFLIGASKNSPRKDLGIIQILQMSGVRVAQPTYQYRNVLANGGGEKNDSGLSNLGVKAIEEMNEVGIVVDLSHVGMKSCMDIIEVSKDPVIFSHSAVKAFVPNVRNVTDEVINNLGEKGGVLGMVAYSPLIRADAQPTIDDFLNHIDHVNELIGPDHIAVGLDQYPPTPPEFHQNFRRLFPEIGGGYKFKTHLTGLDSPDQWKNITRGLVSRGYSDVEVGKILSQNAMRIFQTIW
jgi:membrane dipeptidase